VTRVIYLGNPNAGDDGAALRAAEQIAAPSSVRAGRPGAGLLDLLEGDEPVVLVDVTKSGSRPGTIHRLPLNELVDAALSAPSLSSHGFGPSEALELGRVLGRPLPEGSFVGIEGLHFDPGQDLSPEVESAVPALVETVREAVAHWEERCTKAG
jgi:hydrogenase maturation protease